MSVVNETVNFKAKKACFENMLFILRRYTSEKFKILNLHLFLIFVLFFFPFPK